MCTHAHACCTYRAREAAQDARCEELLEECGAARRAASASAAAARSASVSASEQAQRLANAEGAAAAMGQRLEAACAEAKGQVRARGSESGVQRGKGGLGGEQGAWELGVGVGVMVSREDGTGREHACRGGACGPKRKVG